MCSIKQLNNTLIITFYSNLTSLQNRLIPVVLSPRTGVYFLRIYTIRRIYFNRRNVRGKKTMQDFICQPYFFIGERELKDSFMVIIFYFQKRLELANIKLCTSYKYV